MSKAIEGAAMLTGALGLGVASFFLASTGVGVAALPFLAHAMEALAVGGISMEAAAIAGALTSNRGTNITTRQAAGYRQIIRGRRRVGGTLIYKSTTGSHKDQVNYVIAVASHQIFAFTGLYLDGRQVFWQPNSVGYTTRNSSDFGGTASSGTHTGPDGVPYDFGGKVYAEAKFGDQLPGDVIGGLTANDPVWAARNGRSPFGGGVAYLYIKREHDPNLFPSDPEIRITVAGKCDIYDPRTGTRGYTDNWALHVADHLSDPLAGFGDVNINEDQLIAAANVCDERVPLAAGGNEARYVLSANYDTSMSPGNILNKMMEAAAGRVRYVGGELHIFPGYWQGPSFQFTGSDLCGGISSEPVLGVDQLCNRVTGTYTAPNYPYNVAGNLYDSNGFYEGQIQNNWNFAWQSTNFPQYARDPEHGYASAEDLNQDSGVQGAWAAGTIANEDDVYTLNGAIWRSLQDGNTAEPSATAAGWVNGALILQDDIQLDWVISITQAQRLAKIHMMRKRYQGRFTLPMFLSAYRLQPLDVMTLTLPEMGWSGKLLEVDLPVLRAVSRGENEPPALQVDVPVSETAADIYEWSTAEEQTIYAAQAQPASRVGAVAPPTNLALLSGAGQAVTQPDGTVLPRIEVTWSTPLDAYVTDIQIQYCASGTAAWTDAPPADVSLNAAYIAGVVAGQAYDVRIRARRASGTYSVWVEQDAITAGLVLNAQSQTGIGVGSLVAEAYSNGTAGLGVLPFTAMLGGKAVSYNAAGEVLITGLAQQTLYYLYLIDPTLAGGNLVPGTSLFATTNRADFEGKYFLIDSKVTPYAAAGSGGGGSGGGSGGQRYAPTSFQDFGSRSTSNPQAAFDGDASTVAVISGATSTINTTEGACIFQGFPAIALPAASTLSVVASVGISGHNEGDSSATITAVVNGTATTLLQVAQTTLQATYTCSVPASVPLGSVSIEVSASPSADERPTGPGGGQTNASTGTDSTSTSYYPSAVTVSIAEIYIQS